MNDKPVPAQWLPPLTVEQRTLNALERIEALIRDYTAAQMHPKIVVPAQNTTPKPQGHKKR